MSRVRNFFHAIWSGYLLTIVVSLFNLLTIPIAVAALGKPLYGLWCAVMQLATFTSIFDLGLGPSMARFFTDYKESADRRAYGDFLKSLFFVGMIQGVVFSVVVLGLISHLPGLMGIAVEQHRQFQILLILQLATSALSFPLRPLNQLLFAHQQIARLNGCYIVATLINAAVLVSGLELGWGIYSYIAANWIAFVVNQSGLLFYVLRLGLLPSLREARISLKLLKPVAAFSGNVFITSLGTQLINLAPGLLITRKLGVPALADWTVGTRLISFATQLVSRIPNASEPVFWEMFARQEMARVRQRLLELLLLAGSAAALIGGGIAAMNAPFVALWMASRVQWMTATDFVLVTWVVVSIAAVVFNIVPGMTKHLGSMKFVYLLEGAIMVGLAYVPFVHVQAYWQLALLLLVFECLFRFPYGLWRTWRDLEVPARVLANALGRTFGVAALLLCVAGVLRQTTSHWTQITQIVINGLVYALVALPAVYCLSLPFEPRQRILQAMRRRLQRG
jgi:O-antigen/teichoic acid export membrane protein